MNPTEQLERLLSERRDGNLTAEVLVEVDRAIATDPDAAAAARQYARLDKLLACWRRPPADVDWPTLARQTAERVSAAADQGVDQLLEHWAGPVPEVDWDALKSRISKAVHAEAARAGRRAAPAMQRWRRAANWAARVAVPLAAAAAIAILVWRPMTPTTRTGLGAGVTVGPIVLVSLEGPGLAGSVSVAFEGRPANGAVSANKPEWVPEGGIQFIAPTMTEQLAEADGGVAIAVGLASMEHSDAEEATDEAWLY